MIGFVRSATVLVFALAVAACSDVHDFRGSWTGPRVGDVQVVREGGPPSSTAVLTIDDVDTHGMTGTLAVDGMITETTFTSLAGAEADVLSGMTFAGSPLHVYLSFVETTDGGGAALAVIALYSQHRVELRVLRGSPLPMYGIFSLSEGTP
jgi:hypothetical protein